MKKNKHFLSERSPQTFTTLTFELVPLVFGGAKTSFKKVEKAQLAFLESQRQLIKLENKIPFPKIFSNLNIQLKNMSKSNCVSSHKFAFYSATLFTVATNKRFYKLANQDMRI